MTAIESLAAAVTALTAAVDAAVNEIGTPHPTETAVQQAANTLQAQADRLNAAVAAANPAPAPALTPAPTPTP